MDATVAGFEASSWYGIGFSPLSMVDVMLMQELMKAVPEKAAL